jgi:hypothetical protein
MLEGEFLRIVVEDVYGAVRSGGETTVKAYLVATVDRLEGPASPIRSCGGPAAPHTHDEGDDHTDS